MDSRDLQDCYHIRSDYPTAIVDAAGICEGAFADGTLNPRIDHLLENSAKLISGEMR
jgi:hypothetical protein